MPKRDPRDPIEEFMKNYGRLYNRLEPRDQEFVKDSLEREVEQLRGSPMAPDRSKESGLGDEAIKAAAAQDFATWKEMVTDHQADRAPDPVKDSPDPAQALTETEKREAVKDFGHAIDAREAREASWAQRVEDGFQASLWDGQGKTDAKILRSAGQEATSWADAMRPEKGPRDMERAIKEMGLGPAIERQEAKEAAQKEAEQAQTKGGEGMER